jgi:hypothetical protein
MQLFDALRITSFNPGRVSFGRHESFPLRYSWLTKGYQGLFKNRQIFESDSATVDLGVGKNMVNAIRYWMRAARILEQTKDGLEITEIGHAIFGENGWDPYLEDEATIWLLHWLLVTNAEIATTWYWFFNHFHKVEFSAKEAQTVLLDFANENIHSKYSVSTLKADVAVLLRMYAPAKVTPRTPIEETLDSPLAALNLVSHLAGSQLLQSRPDRRDTLPIGILGFAVTEIMHLTDSDQIPIEKLMYGGDNIPAPGAVFRLTESSLLAKLEKLVQLSPEYFKLDETAGIHQLYRLKSVQSDEFLKKHYKLSGAEVAA